MKTFLNWIMLFCMVFGALGVSPVHKRDTVGSVLRTHQVSGASKIGRTLRTAIVKPKFGQPGGGIEYSTFDPVRVIIRSVQTLISE
jgi:hypothetical protein